MKFLTKKHRGFTLIELLVVIAIIGILASIVLVSLGGARTEAKIAAIKANMDSMRLSLEMEYTENPLTGYATSTEYDNAKAAAEDGGAVFTDTIRIQPNWYCIESTLPGGGSWCVDSTGYVGGATDKVACSGVAPITEDCAGTAE